MTPVMEVAPETCELAPEPEPPVAEWVLRSGVRVREISFAPDYFVSTIGSVWTRKRGKFQRMKQQTNADGYKKVSLWTASGRKNYYVHRLVLIMFVGPCPEGLEACHGEGGQADNTLDNLRWDTPKANVCDRIRARYDSVKWVPSDETIPF